MPEFSAAEQRFIAKLAQSFEFREAVHRHLLNEGLLSCPTRLGTFNAGGAAQQVNSFGTERFIAEQLVANARNATQFTAIAQEQHNIIRRLDELHGELTYQQADRALAAAIRKAPQICCQLRLRYDDQLTAGDLITMLDRNSAVDRIPTQELNDFLNADLVIYASSANGNPCRVVVEAAYTADWNDADRALRNAHYLQQVTNEPACAVIASVANDAAASELVRKGVIAWHQISERDLRRR